MTAHDDTTDLDLRALAARSAELRRQVVDVQAPTEPPGSWLAAVVPDIMAAQKLAEEHAAGCEARPCERCDRFLCDRCGAPIDGRKRCRPCDDAEYDTTCLATTRASIPTRFRWAIDAKLDNLAPRVKASRALVEAALERPPSSWLPFVGRTAAGKTSLAVAMLDAWVRASPSQRRGSLFVESAWLSRARARHKLGQGECELVEQCLAAPLLLLDDLGQEREDRDGCITDVVYGRSNADLPTWVTCGVEGDAQAFAEHLSKRYDGGFVRRIIENGRRVELGR